MIREQGIMYGSASTGAMIREAAELIRESRLMVVSTGAGMSRESGIRTFRGEEGFWRQYRAEDLASLEGIRKDPGLVWEWYRERLRACCQLQPHAGYRALVRIQETVGRLPLITQNVDGLHQKAGIRDVIELHGSLRTASCLAGCGASPVPMTEDIFSEIPPRCSCGSVLRPDVVLFGENLPEQSLKRAFRLAESCDLMIVIGTSMVVYPAAALPVIALREGARVIEINTEETPLSRLEGTLSLRGTAGLVLPQIAKAVCEE
ncbi:MAG: NAD-dependent deacylase [Candidatus Fermentibacteraceae bacterium]|nr:NAD-dependent deacylase [Candidatus Fermentibacteraceae bacterium]MBN2609704.1 NAD-dependent deacylase [Candidatus Fermentibacteraceae bacterium]